MKPFFPAGSPQGGGIGPPVTVSLLAPDERVCLSRPDSLCIHLGEPPAPGLAVHHQLVRLFRLLPPGTEAAMGFFWLALAVWVADKVVPRRLAPDGWTRRLKVAYPATSPWLGLSGPAEALLNFLTGDHWHLTPRRDKGTLLFRGEWPCPWQPTAVSLFSGGLDSLIGAIDLLEQGHRLILVSHYDFGQLASWQQNLAAALRQFYGSGRLFHLEVRVQMEGAELSLRSRSLLYLALGLLTARAFSPALPLFVPENGWISLNPPLTLNRLGSPSTRTTHPLVLQGLLNLWQKVGLSQELINPYQQKTKGEMVKECANPKLLAALAPLSVSCARPVAGRWRREKGSSCGYCYPCLVRRAALHQRGWDNGDLYRVDVLKERGLLRQRVKGRNLRALCLAVRTWEEEPEEMWSRLILPDGEEPEPVRRLLTAGFLELSDWLRAKGGQEVRDFLADGEFWHHLPEGDENGPPT